MKTTFARTTTRRTRAAARSAASSTIGVAVVGCGYWGPNLIRNFANCSVTDVVMVCDRDQSRWKRVGAMCPGARFTTDLEKVLANPAVDAVAIATPVHTHGEFALAALEAGKHVLVEKPMAVSLSDAEAMVRRAGEREVTLMVDHTFVYSSPVRKMKELLDEGELGELYYVDSVRINLGLFQQDVNVVWDLAPHDLSILDYLVGRPPWRISASGACHAGGHEGIEDVAYLHLDFGGGLLASFHINWLSPVKVRHFILGGSRKSLIYNDLEPAEKIKVYDCGIVVSPSAAARRNALVGYRTGDIWSPRIEEREPLQTMVEHFSDCICNATRPLSDGEAGLRIVRVLEAAQRSIKAQGSWITL
jgi:predicted dehydrogenase